MKKFLYIFVLFGMLIGISACKKEHTHNLVNHEAKDSTCIEVGHNAYEECTECDYTTYEKIDAFGHSLEYYEMVDATCTETGTIEYWYCDVCETKFSDESGVYAISDEELTIEALDHSLEHYEMVDSTCTETGTIECWYCNVCETYFSDEEGTQLIDEENIVITQKEHIDENNDYICDYGCGEVLLAEEKLQQIIQNTLSSSKVTVKEKYIPSATQTTYYFDDNLLYANIEERQQENYYYTEEGITYILTKTNEWTKETTTEVIDYNISYLFDNKFDLEISSDLLIYNCDYGFFEGSIMFGYTNTLGTQVDIKLNDDSTLLEGIYIHDESNNIIYMFEMVYGNDEKIVSTFEDINNYIDGYKYDETTNTYNVYSSQGILDAIDNSEISGTVDNPATIKLMNDINVETEVNEYGYADYGILIETGNIIIDLNGFQLSALNDASSVIQIGSEWGETYNAIVTIEDSSIDGNGKIFAPYIGIYNQGGTLIFNNGTIEVNNTKGDWVSAGIQQYLGSVTMNGGSILVTSVADSRATFGIGEDGTGGTVTINGGYINVNGPVADALYLRDTAYINGGTIECNECHISGSPSQSKIYLGTNEDGVGATFVGGINSWLTLNSLLTDGVGYYDANGNLIEVSDDVKEILAKGDITVKKFDNQ